MKKILLFLFITMFFVWCSKEVENNTQTKMQTNVDSKVDNYVKSDWKNTFIWFVATWCPHCKEEMPIFENFYKENKDNVNMVLFVQDNKKFDWDFTIPQETKNPLTYEQVTWEKCWYIPSYVIYDSNKNIIDKKCWAKLTKDDLETKLITNKNIPMSELQSKWFENWDLWVVLTTSNWKIEIKMFPKEAPKTVMNFLWLVQKWYYNGITFHRVINWFMIQGWDPTATWMWGESIYWSEFEDEFTPNLWNFRWALAMANAWPNTNWSQFFINQVNNNSLDYTHSVFGQVINWMDNVDKIAKVSKDKNDKPTKDVKIIKAEVVKYENGSLKTFNYNFEEEFKKFNDEKLKLVAWEWDTVKVHYILKDNKTWEEIQNSYNSWATLPVVIWQQWTLVKFNESLVWMKVWDKKTIVLSPKEAYWELNDPKSMKEFDKSKFYEFEKNWYKIEAWKTIPTQYWELKIAKVEWNKVTIDFTHKLAWKTLKFDIEMMDITKATK